MYFGNSAKFWLGLQNDFDIEAEKSAIQSELRQIKRFENKPIA
jgi:plasmid maintenance system antidote protein VapI